MRMSPWPFTSRCRRGNATLSLSPTPLTTPKRNRATYVSSTKYYPCIRSVTGSRDPVALSAGTEAESGVCWGMMHEGS
jgi:hypothetical protein